MNKFILLSILLLNVYLSGQEYYCGFDILQKEIEAKFPQEKSKRLRIEKQLYNKNKLGKNSRVAGDNNANRIYEIPIVIHVIESKSPDNNNLSVSDAEIKKWIDDTNKIYATTFGGDIYPDGDGIDNGTKMPFKLVLAKRSPTCEATNGIVRYDFTDLENYNTDGLNSSSTGQGIDKETIIQRAPHWPESSYFNIYVVIAFDGNKGYGGLQGWAGFPSWGDNIYESFMKVQVVKSAGNTTLAHEFGHAMGLYHPFHNEENPNNGDSCPPDTGDCLIDNDHVCDTERTKYFLNDIIPPTNNDINDCTNANYRGVQYNIMNYTNQPKKFTPGQRERALDLFLSQRKSLTESLALLPIDDNSNDNPIDIQNATCTPNNRENNNSFGFIGITEVKLGTIDNITGVDGVKFYSDYTTSNCLTKSLHTDLPENAISKLTIKGGNTNNSHYYKVWIDLNNNGTFEVNELITETRKSNGNELFEFDITPDKIQNAVKNTYLRMRVRSDFYNSGDACANLQYGETEDYAVRIITEDFLSNNVGIIGINTDSPKTTLDVKEVDLNELPEGQPQGVSFPSFSTDERSTFDKTKIKEGTMIYNTTEKCIEIFTDGDWNCLPFRN